VNLTKQLERLAYNGIFINETGYGDQKNNCETQYARAIRTLNGNLSTRTHNISIQDNQIWWENSGSSKEWHIEFESMEEARKLFEKVTGIKVIKKIFKLKA
jgi:uncharacterized protein with ACT and thioredoxin-like domain